MTAGSAKSVESLGLQLLSGADSFLNDLSPEDQAAISGGGRRRSRRTISPPSRFSRRSRRPSPSDRFGGRRAGRRAGRRGGRRRGSFA